MVSGPLLVIISVKYSLKPVKTAVVDGSEQFVHGLKTAQKLFFGNEAFFTGFGSFVTVQHFYIAVWIYHDVKQKVFIGK